MNPDVSPAEKEFVDLVWNHYRLHGRIFSWREDTAPYKVFVSEVMLQQTQTSRVTVKFPSFIYRFPDFESLANADLPDVLREWQGLGYNRRGRFLREAAKEIVIRHDGRLPADHGQLVALAGIGPNTASSILAFAFNIPSVFIETNIRAVFIHHFFSGDSAVHDRELHPLIARCLDRQNPREWYWALMDYGVFLKQSVSNPSRKSAHHVSQSRFEGSVRQVRGSILRALLAQSRINSDVLGALCKAELAGHIQNPDDFEQRFQKALQSMLAEGVVVAENPASATVYRLGS